MWQVLGRILDRTLMCYNILVSLLWFRWESLLFSGDEVPHLFYLVHWRPHTCWMVSMALSSLLRASSSNWQQDCRLWLLLDKGSLLSSYEFRPRAPAHPTMWHERARGCWTLQECSWSTLLRARRWEVVGLDRGPGAGGTAPSTCRRCPKCDFCRQAGPWAPLTSCFQFSTTLLVQVALTNPFLWNSVAFLFVVVLAAPST